LDRECIGLFPSVKDPGCGADPTHLSDIARPSSGTWRMSDYGARTLLLPRGCEYVYELAPALPLDDLHAPRAHRPGPTLCPTEASVVRGQLEAIETRPLQERNRGQSRLAHARAKQASLLSALSEASAPMAPGCLSRRDCGSRCGHGPARPGQRLFRIVIDDPEAGATRSRSPCSSPATQLATLATTAPPPIAAVEATRAAWGLRGRAPGFAGSVR